MSRAVFVLLPALALAACATVEPMPASPPGGQWIVVTAHAANGTPNGTSPYHGQMVTLDAERAIDPAGRLCKKPAYLNGAKPSNPKGRQTLEVVCAGSPFGTYVQMADGSMLTQINDWSLTLERAPSVAAAPAAVIKVEAAPPPVTALPAQPAPAAKPVVVQDPRTLVYLASYKTEKTARDGFRTLSKASPILAGQQPILQSVDLPKKGSWVRLYGMAADEAERAKMCTQLGKLVDECGSRFRE